MPDLLSTISSSLGLLKVNKAISCGVEFNFSMRNKMAKNKSPLSIALSTFQYHPMLLITLSFSTPFILLLQRAQKVTRKACIRETLSMKLMESQSGIYGQIISYGPRNVSILYCVNVRVIIFKYILWSVPGVS